MVSVVSIFFVIQLLCVVRSETNVDPFLLKENRIGIIGGGITGLSSAFFAREKFGPEADITVFERSSKMGGRIESIEINQTIVEMGARFFHPTNQFLSEFITSGKFQASKPSTSDSHAVWDGSKFLFRESMKTSWGNIETAFRLFWAYKLDPIWVKRAGSNIPRDIFRLYDNLRTKNESFLSVNDLFSVFEEYMMAQEFRDYLMENNHNKDYVDDVVDALLRVRNPLGIRQQVFPALVDIQITNFQSFLVNSGLSSVLDYIQEQSNARILLGTTVVDVKEVGEIVLLTTDDGTVHEFDYVIIGAPLSCSGLNISGMLEEQYLPVHTMAVVGSLNFTYFGLENETNSSLPHKILTSTKHEKNLPFTSIIAASEASQSTDKDIRVYSVSSESRIHEQELHKIFSEIVELKESYFPCGYPDTLGFDNNKLQLSFQLSSRVYYPNVAERLVSTVETQIISAYNTISHISHISQ